MSHILYVHREPHFSSDCLLCGFPVRTPPSLHWLPITASYLWTSFAFALFRAWGIIRTAPIKEKQWNNLLLNNWLLVMLLIIGGIYLEIWATQNCLRLHRLAISMANFSGITRINSRYMVWISLVCSNVSVTRPVRLIFLTRTGRMKSMQSVPCLSWWLVCATNHQI